MGHGFHRVSSNSQGNEWSAAWEILSPRYCTGQGLLHRPRTSGGKDRSDRWGGGGKSQIFHVYPIDTYSDIWWLMEINGDLWWFMAICGDFLDTYDDFDQLHSGSWWVLVNFMSCSQPRFVLWGHLGLSRNLEPHIPTVSKCFENHISSSPWNSPQIGVANINNTRYKVY